MTYLFALLALGILAVVAFQILSVIKNDQKKIDDEIDGEPVVMENKIDYSAYDSESTDHTLGEDKTLTYTFAGKTETDVVEVKEKKAKKKSYYKKKDKNSSKVVTKKGGNKKKGGKDDLLLS